MLNISKQLAQQIKTTAQGTIISINNTINNTNLARFDDFHPFSDNSLPLENPTMGTIEVLDATKAVLAAAKAA